MHEERNTIANRLLITFVLQSSMKLKQSRKDTLYYSKSMYVEFKPGKPTKEATQQGLVTLSDGLCQVT